LYKKYLLIENKKNDLIKRKTLFDNNFEKYLKHPNPDLYEELLKQKIEYTQKLNEYKKILKEYKKNLEN
jgi:hypothetical protein